MKLYYFNACWCSSCLVMKPIYKKLLNKFNIEMIEYDYDLDEDMVEKYNISDKLPTSVLIDENDLEVKRIIGEKKENDLEIIFIELLGEGNNEVS